MSTEKTNKTNNNYYIYGAIGVVILLIFGFVFLKGCSGSNDENKEEDTGNVEKIGATEKDIIASYGVSKQDAINMVKEIYNSENFEFSADINEDSMYIVSVKNTITESVDKYLVDPTSTEKSFYLITE